MTSTHEVLRGIKKRDWFKESDEISEKDLEYWKDWLNKNEKSIIDEIGEVFEKEGECEKESHKMSDFN